MDAVVITTPDFLHIPILVAACQAGKDTYCEKPMAMNVKEAREAVDAVRSNNRIVQIGTQRRSDPQYQQVVKVIQSGVLGKITAVNSSWNDAGPRWELAYNDIKRDDVDWDAFVNHLPARPFDPRHLRCWKIYRDYTVGSIGLLGVHAIDTVLWSMNAPYPLNAVANGGRFIWKNREHMDTIRCEYVFPQGFILSYETLLGNLYQPAEVVYYGTNGLLRTEPVWKLSGDGKVDWSKVRNIYPELAAELDKTGSMDKDITAEKSLSSGSFPHILNWLECLRSRKEPNAPVEAGYAHSLVAKMGHLAADSGKRIVYDPAKREVSEG